MLGGPWFVTGEVIHGEKRGRDLGYPTANIRLDKNCGLKHGIYAVRVGRGQGIDQVRLDGVASFGRRPTFDNGAPLLEVFLFDFKGDLYGATLDVAFIGFIREELKFDQRGRAGQPDGRRQRRGPRAAGRGAGGVSEARDGRRQSPSRAASKVAGFAIPRPPAMESPMFARRTIGISGPASA